MIVSDRGSGPLVLLQLLQRAATASEKVQAVALPTLQAAAAAPSQTPDDASGTS
jgi:hypothetical protein